MKLHNFILVRKYGIRREKWGCWGICGRKGGSCHHCGVDGFCCSPTRHELNGNCPAEALLPLLTNYKNTNETYHMCTGPIKSVRIKPIATPSWALWSTWSDCIGCDFGCLRRSLHRYMDTRTYRNPQVNILLII